MICKTLSSGKNVSNEMGQRSLMGVSMSLNRNVRVDVLICSLDGDTTTLSKNEVKLLLRNQLAGKSLGEYSPPVGRVLNGEYCARAFNAGKL